MSRGFVVPVVPAAKAPWSVTASTAGSTTGQLSTFVQNCQANFLSTGHSTVCSNVHIKAPLIRNDSFAFDNGEVFIERHLCEAFDFAAWRRPFDFQPVEFRRFADA